MIIINTVLNISDKIIEEMIKYFNNDVEFGEIYPNFPQIRMGEAHPFTVMMENQINGSEGEKTVFNQDLFPSITVVDDSSGKDQSANVRTLKEEYIFTEEAIDKIKNNRDIFLISDSQLKELDELFVANPTETFAWKFSQVQRSNMVIEIWSENKKIKNTIFELVRNFLNMNGRFTLKTDYDIIIAEDSVAGDKEGNYNYDFGKTLHAGLFRFNVSYKIAQYIIDDIEFVSDVEVNINDLLKEE